MYIRLNHWKPYYQNFTPTKHDPVHLKRSEKQGEFHHWNADLEGCDSAVSLFISFLPQNLSSIDTTGHFQISSKKTLILYSGEI